MKSQRTNKNAWLSAAIGVAFLILFAQPQRAAAQQWTTNGNHISNTNSGNVGIGTTNPAEKLDILSSGTARVIAGDGCFNMGVYGGIGLGISSFSGCTNYSILGDGANTYFNAPSGFLFFRRGNVSQMTIHPSGNIGIGLENPAYKLEVQGSSSRNTMALFGDGDVNGYAGIKIGALTTTSIANNRTSQFNLHMRKDSWYGGDGSGPSFIIETVSKVGGFAAPFLITPTNDVILNGGAGASGLSYGNVGIGTTNPIGKLHLNGNLIIENAIAWSYLKGPNIDGIGLPSDFTSNQGLALGWNISRGGGEYDFVANRGAGGVGGFRFYDYSGGTANPLVTILGSGNMGIGTISPGAKLDVQGTIASNRNWFFLAGAGDTNHAIGNISGDGEQFRYFNFLDFYSPSGGGNVRLLSNGNVGIGTVSPGFRLDVQGGQVNAAGGLCIAGDCKTAWSQVGGGTPSQWTTSGSSIYYNTGNVGVGNDSPGSKLFVGSGTPAAGTLPGLNVALGGNSYVSASNGTINTFVGSDTSSYGIIGTLSNHPLGLRANNTLAMTVLPNGNVGVGTASPVEKLEVSGNLSASGTITGGNIVAKYQDVAEWVPASEQISAGTVVVLDSAKSNQVISSAQAYDTRVAGVISEKPGIALGESGDNKVLVATTGRVRIKVDATRGPINIGDLLVTSDISGMAMKSEPLNIGGVQIHRPGTLIGKALEPLAKGQGEILVLLSLQ